MASKLTLWINQKLRDKGISAKDAQKDAGKYKSIAAAKKAGSLYYTDKNGKVKIAAYAEDLKNVGKKSEDTSVKTTELPEPSYMQTMHTRENIGKSSRAKGKSPDDITSKTTIEKRDPSERIQALKGVSNAKLASRIRAKLSDPSFRKSRGLNTLKNNLEATLKMDTSTKDGERAQKMRLDSLLTRVDRMIMNKGGVVKKKKMALGGMMNDKKINPSTGLSMSMGGLGRKVNPSTGLSMNKGGMTDYRKSGMFYGGGMARKR